MLRFSYSRVCALLVSTVLLVESLGYAISPAAAEQADEKREIPPITSTASPARPEPVKADFTLPWSGGKPVVPDGKGRIQTQRPLPQGKADEQLKSAKEIVSQRTLNAKVFQLADGSHAAKVFESPVHFKDASGALKDIDTKLVSDPSGHHNTAGPFAAHISSSADSPELATLEADGTRLSVTMSEAAASPVAAGDSEAKFNDAGGPNSGLDVKFMVGNTHLEQMLVLKSKPQNEASSVFRFPLALQGLTAKSEYGGVGFYKADQLIYAMAAPTMYDSTGGPTAGPPAYGKATITLEQSPAPAIVVTADYQWLSSTERKYPVSIDPAFSYFGAGRAGGGEDSTVIQSYPDSNFNVACCLGSRYVNYVGYWPTLGLSHAYMNYDLSFLNNKNISFAAWYGYFPWIGSDGFYRLQRASGPWSANTLTFNNRPALTSDYVDGDVIGSETWSSIAITNWVHNWTHGVWANNGLAVHTSGYSDSAF